MRPITELTGRYHLEELIAAGGWARSGGPSTGSWRARWP